jgi:hypothetical protein
VIAPATHPPTVSTISGIRIMQAGQCNAVCHTATVGDIGIIKRVPTPGVSMKRLSGSGALGCSCRQGIGPGRPVTSPARRSRKGRGTSMVKATAT